MVTLGSGIRNKSRPCAGRPRTSVFQETFYPEFRFLAHQPGTGRNFFLTSRFQCGLSKHGFPPTQSGVIGVDKRRHAQRPDAGQLSTTNPIEEAVNRSPASARG